MINLLVLKENTESEKRVALVPNEIKKYIDIGFKITIEKDAGIKSGFSNEAYKKENANNFSAFDTEAAPVVYSSPFITPLAPNPGRHPNRLIAEFVIISRE